MRSYFCFNRILAGVICLLLTATLFYACSKNANDDPKTANSNDNLTLTAAGDQAIVNSYYDDLFVVALEIAENASFNIPPATPTAGRKHIEGSLKTKLGTCFDYKADLTDWPKTISASFQTGCADADGRVRAGDLQITFSSYFYYTDAVIVVKPTTYTVNGISVTGTVTIRNISDNSTYKYSVAVADGLVNLDTATVKFGGSGTYTLTEGAKTLSDVSDDVFSYVGSDSLVYGSGKIAYITVADSAALERKVSCRHISKGKSTVTFGDMKAIVDYGNGICDDSVVLTLGDKVKAFVLTK